MLLGMILGATASAQLPEEAQGQKPPPPPPPPLIGALDLDRDGRLSAEEVKKAPESLRTLDENGNGRLSEKELSPPPRKDGEKPEPEGGRPHGPPPAPKDGEAPHGPPPGGPDAGPQGPPPAGPEAGAPEADGPRGPNDRPRPPRPQGPSPLLRVLDKNHDGNLSNKEIDDASEALLEHDENGDGALTMDELRPKDGPGFGPGGPPPHGPGRGGPPPHGPGGR